MEWSELAEAANRVVVDTLGMEVTWQPLAGGDYTIRGVFNKDTIPIDQGLEVADLKPKPTLMVKVSDLPARPKPKDRVTISGTIYTVEESREDGQGGTVLMLYKKI